MGVIQCRPKKWCVAYTTTQQLLKGMVLYKLFLFKFSQTNWLPCFRILAWFEHVVRVCPIRTQVCLRTERPVKQTNKQIWCMFTSSRGIEVWELPCSLSGGMDGRYRRKPEMDNNDNYDLHDPFHCKEVLHPWPILWLFMYFSPKLQHSSDK